MSERDDLLNKIRGELSGLSLVFVLLTLAAMTTCSHVADIADDIHRIAEAQHAK